MSIHVGASGAHKEVTSVSVGASGAWKTANDVWVGAGGVWKRVLASLIAYLDPSYSASASDSSSPFSSSCGFRLMADGSFERGIGNNGAAISWLDVDIWLVTGSNSDFEARITGLSGTTPTGMTADTWYVLSSDRTFTITRAGAGVSTCSGTLEIRRVSDSSLAASATFTLTCTNEA